MGVVGKVGRVCHAVERGRDCEGIDRAKERESEAAG